MTLVCTFLLFGGGTPDDVSTSNSFRGYGCVFPTFANSLTKGHDTGNFIPYTFRIVCGFFNVPHQTYKYGNCETGPTVYSPYPRRFGSLTLCWCNYKGSTFYLVILRPLVLVWPESNS